MTLEVDCDGEHHGSGYNAGVIAVGDNIYCETCYDALESRDTELEQEVKEKDEQIEGMESQVQELELQLSEARGG